MGAVPFRRIGSLAIVIGLAITVCTGCATGASPNQNASPPPNGAPPGGGPGGGAQSETSGTAVTTFSADTSQASGSYASTGADENAVRVEGGANVSLTGPAVNKTGDSSDTDNSDFYGMNAGILVRDGAVLTLSGGSVTTDASGGNGIFVYNTASSATSSDATIRTSKDNSGGIEVAGGGQIIASNLDIVTQGNSAAALRSDRGGGTMNVTGGTYTTNGTGSPAIYSTAEIDVSGATLIANNSEAVVIEGANSVSLTNCTATGDMAGTYGADSGENIHSVMIYQSMSGDATQGGGAFSMTGGSLTGINGDLFYVTNTTATINLQNVALTEGIGNLLTVAGNDGSRGWGSLGNNGGSVTLTASQQTLAGAIEVDSISSLDMSLASGSTFTGTINSTNLAGTVNVTLSADSKWVLTADANISAFNGSASNIVAQGHHLYAGGEQVV